MPQIKCSRRNACENVPLVSSWYVSFLVRHSMEQSTLGLVGGLRAAQISRTPEATSEIFHSREARAQVLFFIQQPTLVYRISQTLSNTWIVQMFCFASDGKQRAELFIDISDSVMDDSQCFSHQTDSSQLTQPHS